MYETIASQYLDTNKFSYQFDRKLMSRPPLVVREVAITRDSAVCDNCWSDLWFQMILRYRMDINAQLPSAVSTRPPCYYVQIDRRRV